MGLTDKFETIWNDGRRVLIHPSGQIDDLASGQTIRSPTIPQLAQSYPSVNLPTQNQGMSDSTKLMIFCITVIALLIIATRK